MNAADFQRLSRIARLVRTWQLANDPRANMCVSNTFDILYVLRELGYNARPLVVRCLVSNPAMVALRSNPAWQAMEMDERTARCNATSAFEIGIGHEVVTEGHWAGHMIAELPADDCFVDISIDQANDPANDILISEPLFSLSRRALKSAY